MSFSLPIAYGLLLATLILLIVYICAKKNKIWGWKNVQDEPQKNLVFISSIQVCFFGLTILLFIAFWLFNFSANSILRSFAAAIGHDPLAALMLVVIMLVITILFIWLLVCIDRALLKGNVFAFCFLLFEIIIIMIDGFYNLPLNNAFRGGPELIACIIWITLLWRRSELLFSEQQKILLKYFVVVILVYLVGHILITPILYKKDNVDYKRSVSSEWHANFQPDKSIRYDSKYSARERAKEMCTIIEDRIRFVQISTLEEGIPVIDRLMKEANLGFTSQSKMARGVYVYSYTYNVNSFINKLTFSAINYFHINLIFKAVYGNDGTVRKFELAKIDCFYYPYGVELYNRPKKPTDKVPIAKEY